MFGSFEEAIKIIVDLVPASSEEGDWFRTQVLGKAIAAIKRANEEARAEYEAQWETARGDCYLIDEVA